MTAPAMGCTQLARTHRLFLVFACWFAWVPSIWGQQKELPSDADSPISNALRTTPWFDAEKNSLTPIEVNPEADDTDNRDSRWLPKPKAVSKPKNTKAKAPATPATNNGNTAGTGTGLFGSGLSFMNLLGWLTLGLIVIAGIGAIYYVLSRADLKKVDVGKRKENSAIRANPGEQTIERMQQLPEELRRTDVNLRSEAQRLMQSGEYDQAIILLFAHQLLLLDGYGALRLNRGKTNRRYIRETRAVNPDAAKCLAVTIEFFERSYFGRHKITQSEFATMWRANEQLETGLQQSQGEAA